MTLYPLLRPRPKASQPLKSESAYWCFMALRRSAQAESQDPDQLNPATASLVVIFPAPLDPSKPSAFPSHPFPKFFQVTAGQGHDFVALADASRGGPGASKTDPSGAFLDSQTNPSKP